MKPKTYLETTVISYLCARSTRDLVIAAHQELTREWWTNWRQSYDVFVSQLVFEEAGAGDPEAAARRLALLQSVVRLDIDDRAITLAKALVDGLALPARARADALHIGVSAANGMDYLLTWNCAHIANAALRHRIELICKAAGCDPPVICTPQELLNGGVNDE